MNNKFSSYNEDGYFYHFGLKTTNWKKELGSLYEEYLLSSNV